MLKAKVEYLPNDQNWIEAAGNALKFRPASLQETAPIRFFHCEGISASKSMKRSFSHPPAAQLDQDEVIDFNFAAVAKRL